MNLSDITGPQLVTAYCRLYPTEIEPNQVPIYTNIFALWLKKIRAGEYRHQVSLGNSYTARKTFALLWLLQGDTPPPADIAAVVQLLVDQTDWHARMTRRLSRVNPPRKQP